MAVQWITQAGNLTTLTERVPVTIPLQVSTDQASVALSVISGSLPRGMKLVGNNLIGSAVEVSKFTVYRFVIRANDGQDIEDRTFSISVDGADAPIWITKEGFLNVGQGETYFVLDNAFVDFQLEAYDTDQTAGDVLEYYISPMGGELPPGLSLTKDGRITGFTDPIFSVEYGNAVSGAYDSAAFDIAPLDKPKAGGTGFDSYIYDQFEYDFSESVQTPRKLSRAYTFVVSVTDGRTETKRLFRMWVVTEDFLKADNTIVEVDTNLFTADNSSDRVPYWITESYLGRRRANNYLTIFLDVYRAPGLDNRILYFLESQNPNGTASVLPEGMELDQNTGEIGGRVPYQAAVTKTYTFTISAVDFKTEIVSLSYNLRGVWNSTVNYLKNDAVSYNGFIYVATQGSRSKIPTDEDFWASSVAVSTKTFSIDIIGEIESAIVWLTDPDLGSIEPNKPSTLLVEARSSLYGNTTSYEIVNGTLPPGLQLLSTGIIQGKVRQFGSQGKPGMIRFYDVEGSERTFNTTFDNNTTSFDRFFNFTINARDSARFAQIERSFTLRVISESNTTFANVYLKSFQPKSKRLDWFNFITDSNIFRTDELYRYGDPNFGIQSELKMILFAGIESVEAVRFVQAMSRNHYRKKLKFGEVKTAKAKDPVTQETIYEVVYVDIVDGFEKNGKSISQTLQLSDNINSKVLISYDAIKVDSNIPFVSDRDHQRIFPNSIKNMRSRLFDLGERDRKYLPLWMRSIQDNTIFESGYVKALPLCYTNPGKSDAIAARVKLSGFDFKLMDFEADRYLIDILDGDVEYKYLAFPQIGEKLP